VALDGSDGEIARYNRRFMSDEEDAIAFMHGVYLDKVFHAIEKPFWGMSIALGVYRATSEWYVFLAGFSLCVFHGFCRQEVAAQSLTVAKLRGVIQRVRNAGGFTEMGLEAAASRLSPLHTRVVEKVAFWMRNGKRFNLLILLAGLLDCGLELAGTRAVGVQSVLVACGVLAPLLMVHTMYRTVASRALVAAACKAVDDAKWRQGNS
jgi:hypothetical protein